MKFRRYHLLLLLLSLPLPGYSLDIEGTLRELALIALVGLAGLAAVIASLVATVQLMWHLWQPEATDPDQRRAAGWRIAGLTLPATAMAWWVVGCTSYSSWYYPAVPLTSHGSWYYPAVPLILLLGLMACLLLWWRRRPTAALALLSGLLIVGGLAGAARLLSRTAPKPPAPLGVA